MLLVSASVSLWCWLRFQELCSATTMAGSRKGVSFPEEAAQTTKALKRSGAGGLARTSSFTRPVALRVPTVPIDTRGVTSTSQASNVKSPASFTGVARVMKTAKSTTQFLHRQPLESRAMAETLNPVERDGLVENIYELLRCASSSRDNPRFTSLRLPDTVIIRNGLIYRWYFTSKNGNVLRKNRSRLHRAEVRDALLAKGAKNRSKIVAVYLTSTSARIKPRLPQGDESDSRPPSPSTPGRPQDIRTHTPVVHCDYLDAAQLRLFLEDDVLQRNGILQGFVEPNTDRMSTIEATFSPATTLIERRMNVNKLDDCRFPAVERMVTFDGAEHYSDIVPVQRPQTVAGLKDGCRAIKEHIAGVEPFYLDVGRMVLYLREDSKQQLWLLWCTSFRCTPRPDDPTEIHHGPLALHTRITVDSSGKEGSTRRREKAAGVGSVNLLEKDPVPTTGMVVQDPTGCLREWGPEVVFSENLPEEQQKVQRRHLVYNVPAVGLLDVLFEPGRSVTGGKPDGYVIKDRNGEAAVPGSTAAKISLSEKHMSTRLTKGMKLASGTLYNDALLVCQMAPDLEILKSTGQHHLDNCEAAQTLWSVTEEKAREREAVRDAAFLQQEENKKAQQHTHKVRVLKKHRGIDGVKVDMSLTLDDLATAAASDDATGQSTIRQAQRDASGAAAGSSISSPTVQVPGDEEGQDPSAPKSEGQDNQVDTKAGRNGILKLLGCSEENLDPELQRELEMLRGLPRDHPTMLAFIRRQRQKLAKGENLNIKTEESDKKAAERRARITRARMGRTSMQSKSPSKISKDQLLEVTRRHTSKLPKRPSSAPAMRAVSQGASKDAGLHITELRRRVRPVSVNASYTTAARWGVHTGTSMVDEAAALQDVADRHSKAIKAAVDSIPRPQRPLWKSQDSATATSGAGGLKQVAQMRARSARAASSAEQQRVPVPPTAEKQRRSGTYVRPESAPSGRTTADHHATTEIDAQRRATSELRYRVLLGYDDGPVARPASAAPTRTRPASARPISSAFGDSDTTSAREHTATTKRRAQSAGARASRSVSARPQSAVVPGKMASPRSRLIGPDGDAWLKNVLAQTQSLIASVKKDQELYSAEADALQGQLHERAGMNIAAYHHVRVPLRH